jgi:hypothetical protein
VTISIGLVLALISALAVNWAYSREHDAAAAMPRFSPRRPPHFVSLLLGSRAWLVGFATETFGWLVYVAALRLAPISLVQAVCASGIAILAVITARGHPSKLARNEQIAVAIAVVGLVLLALSLVNTHESDKAPGLVPLVLWLGSTAAAALFLTWLRVDLPRSAALGLAAGLLFAGGDISAKVVVYGGVWLVVVLTLIAFYALGTSVLQGAFQHGDALTAAGLATLATNAIPIAAGFIVFGEELPSGAKGGLQLVAFASLVISGAFLARTRRIPAPTLTDGGEAVRASRPQFALDATMALRNSVIRDQPS